MVHGTGKAPRSLDGNERVVAVHIHVKVNRGVRHQGANGAQADDAELFAHNFRACEGFLRLFGRLGDVLVVSVLAAPFDTARNVARTHHKASNHELLHGVRVRARRVENDDALFRALVQRNVVHASTCTGNSAQVLGELHVVQRRAAHQDAFGLVEVFRELIARGQQRDALVRNVVEAVNGVGHENPSERNARTCFARARLCHSILRADAPCVNRETAARRIRMGEGRQIAQM